MILKVGGVPEIHLVQHFARHVFQRASWTGFFPICCRFSVPNGDPVETFGGHFFEFRCMFFQSCFRSTIWGELLGRAGGRGHSCHARLPLLGAANLKASPLPPAFLPTGDCQLVSCWNCSYCHGLLRFISCLLERMTSGLKSRFSVCVTSNDF